MNISIDLDKNRSGALDACIEVTARRAYKPSIGKKILTLIIAFGGILILFNAAKNGKVIFGLLGLCFLGFGLVFFYMTSRSYFRKNVARQYKELDESLYTGTREYTIDDDGIHAVVSDEEYSCSWESITDWDVYGRYLYAVNKENRFILIDCKQISKAERMELKQIFSENTAPDTRYAGK